MQKKSIHLLNLQKKPIQKYSQNGVFQIFACSLLNIKEIHHKPVD